ncbi:PadR family transcriptional regulator [Nocardia sp. BMG51109]|uniref:PadR family transcriptional regulator n=1 Tax=Nocardia sp. BMG51109 TaxID=1056816 RepID=UPI0004654E85|nr:helix-turn-helix transcriptional regulator [Nocardia sp. BMG51109]
MAQRRKVGNLLALAVLATLAERPMHRYEIAATLKERGKERDMDIKWGSLYTVVRNLEKHGLLEIIGNERAGARPERTIYRLTEAGRAEADDWVRELLATPEPEPRRFVSALSIAAMLPPDDVVTLLTERLRRLDHDIAAERESLAAESSRIPRLFLIESEYRAAMLEAERAWVTALRDELTAGTFAGVDFWRRMHAEDLEPAEVADMVERGDFRQSNDA